MKLKLTNISIITFISVLKNLQINIRVQKFFQCINQAN